MSDDERIRERMTNMRPLIDEGRMQRAAWEAQVGPSSYMEALQASDRANQQAADEVARRDSILRRIADANELQRYREREPLVQALLKSALEKLDVETGDNAGYVFGDAEKVRDFKIGDE